MSATNYRVLDATGRDLTNVKNPPTTVTAARRVARFHGTGSRVVGARGQTLYVVEPPNKRDHAKKHPAARPGSV